MDCTTLLLRWCGVLLNNAQMYLSTLLVTNNFLQMIEELINFGCNSVEHYSIEIVLDDLIIFLLNPNNWDSKVKNYKLVKILKILLFLEILFIFK